MPPKLSGGLYQPLAADEIRVLGFDRDSTGAALKLNLIPVPRPNLVDNRPNPSSYHALSYTWGDENPGGKRRVLVNNTEFHVSQNLYDILLHLRDNAAFRDPSFRVWIDAVCINQEDEAEKSSQVGRMRETYQGASKVIVWLGHDEQKRDATGRAAAFLSEKLPPVREGQDGMTIVRPLPLYLKDPANEAVLRTIGRDILRRPWWWRVWVIQEVALARSIIVVCDQHHFFWEHLFYVFTWMRFLGMGSLGLAFDEGESNPYFPNIIFKSTYRYNMMVAPDTSMPVLELLQNASACLATDPKDMIYSLLGIATDMHASSNPRDDKTLVIDYRKETPVQDIYVAFAKVHVNTYREHPGSNPLDVITFSRHGLTRLPGLPSWVPDWSNMRATSCYSLAKPGTPSRQRAAILPHYLFSASRGRDSNISFEGGNALRVSGVRVDKITAVGKPFEDDEELIDIVLEWASMALADDSNRATDAYRGGPWMILEAFNRTVTADTEVDGRRHRQHQGCLYLWGLLAEALDLLPLELDGPNPEILDDVYTRYQRTMRAIQLRALRRRFFITSSGMFGLGPMAAEVGDVVFVLLGCSVPVVLRQEGRDWNFVGEAFVAGIMDGEAANAEAHVESVIIK